ncbi:PTS transporter subunit EIIC [Lacticaseibacillus suilingensis]|uniref:PTS transporter subunit EIIC n=1 Tax=Lacticaseibacillus suilingensis TaxID=2799577 RepID=A0ABW4BBA5_9LACO|nr:PTS transporter subunit EIIC [Lacticaseibacillus suilingensis]
MAQYTDLSKFIVAHIGGPSNVVSLVHCFTRLRFVLKDESIAETEMLKDHDGIIDVMQAGGQYQIVIGMHVEAVFDEVDSLYHFPGASDDSDTEEQPVEATQEKKSLWEKAVELLSGIFVPLLGILCASGMIKGLLAILSTAGILHTTDGTYIILYAIGDALFYFFPFFLAISASKKFHVDQMTAVAIAGSILYPTLISALSGKPLATIFSGTVLASKTYLTFLHIPVLLNNYSSTVIPIIIAVWFASIIQRWAKKISPKSVANFLVPMLTLLITVPMTLLVVGPVATWLSNIIAWVVQSLYHLSPILVGAFIGGFWQILVIFGIHNALIPIVINNLATQGYDIIFAANIAGPFTQLATLLALALVLKNQNKRETTIAAIFPAIFGITEPAIYGVTLPMKTPFIISCISSAFGGVLAMLMGVKFYQMGGQGIFAFPCFLSPKATDFSGMISAIIVVLISMALAFTMTVITYRFKAKTSATEALN